MYDADDGRYGKGTLRADLSEDGRDLLFTVGGGDWQIQEIATAMRRLTALPRTFRKKYDGQLNAPCTWAIVTQCARLAEQHGFTWQPSPGLNQWIYDEFMRRHEEDGDLKFDVTSLSREPMPHQKAGAFVAAQNGRMFLADAAGTGKSFSALLALAELEARGHDPFPAFIVAPASVVDPWMEEIEECFPGWPVAVYRGTKRKSLSDRYKLYVMSWDVFRRDMQFPKDENGNEDKNLLPSLVDFVAPRSVVLDEAHALVNTKTRQSVAARRIARIAEFAVLLSGTPITRDIGGFWSALNVLDIRSFPDQERYKERYCDRIKQDYGQDKVTGLTSVNREEFYTLMQGTMRRVSKKEVLKDLPDKTYQQRIIDIPPAYRAAYDEMEEDMVAHIPDTEEPLPVMSTLAQLTRLTQLASSACDVEITYELDEKEDSPTFGEEVPRYHVTMREPSWKVTELMSLMAESDGEPIVVTAPHAQLMELAGKRAASEGYRVGYIKGGQTAARRTANRKAFQAGELDLLCVTTSAGGVGLTLHRAHTMVFLERPFAFWQADQTEDRLHRRGQSEKVTIIDVVARNTVEAKVRQAIREKAKSLSELVRDPRILREVLGGGTLAT